MTHIVISGEVAGDDEPPAPQLRAWRSPALRTSIVISHGTWLDWWWYYSPSLKMTTHDSTLNTRATCTTRIRPKQGSGYNLLEVLFPTLTLST